jgi:hypothetical protein
MFPAALLAASPDESWWHKIQWGDVSGWFSGVLTALSLLLAFYLLLQNRRRDESRQADEVTSWYEESPLGRSDETGHHVWQTNVSLRNNSSHPISKVAMAARRYEKRRDIEPLFPRLKGNALSVAVQDIIDRPGTMTSRRVLGNHGRVAEQTTVSREMDFDNLEARNFRIEVFFNDARGKTWAINVRTGELRRAKLKELEAYSSI